MKKLLVAISLALILFSCDNGSKNDDFDLIGSFYPLTGSWNEATSLTDGYTEKFTFVPVDPGMGSGNTARKYTYSYSFINNSDNKAYTGECMFSSPTLFLFDYNNTTLVCSIVFESAEKLYLYSDNTVKIFIKAGS
jgi:hypothetical protein